MDLGQTLFSDRASARVLRNFPRIESLQLPHEGPDEWVKVMVSIPTLRAVTFYRSKLTDDGARDLAKITWLESLQLSESRISPRALDDIAKLTKLTFLGMSNLNEKFGGKDLQKLAVLSNLEGLTIHKWSVTPEDIEAFKSELPGCKIHYTGEDGREEVRQ